MVSCIFCRLLPADNYFFRDGNSDDGADFSDPPPPSAMYVTLIFDHCPLLILMLDVWHSLEALDGKKNTTNLKEEAKGKQVQAMSGEFSVVPY